MNDSTSTIQTPIKFRLRRAAASGLPILFFIGSCGICVLLWQSQFRAVTLNGVVESVEFVVHSPRAGVVAQLVPSDGKPLTLYSHVKADQLLAQMDDRAVRERLDLLQQTAVNISDESSADLQKLETENSEHDDPPNPTNLPSGPNATDFDASDESVEPTREVSAWRLLVAYSERSLRTTDLLRQTLAIRQLDSQIRDHHEQSTDDPESELGQLKLRRQQSTFAIENLRTQLAFDQSTNIDRLTEIDENSFSSPARIAQWRSYANRCRLVDSQLAAISTETISLDIVSPVDGQVEKTHVQPLQAVAFGDPIATVIPSRGNYIVVYSRENENLRPFSGMPVTLQSRLVPGQRAQAVVESVGPKVESLPTRHRRNPRVEEWGRPMRIPLPDDWILEPGGLIDVIVRTGSTAR